MWSFSAIEKSTCFILAHPGQSWAGFAEIMDGLGEVKSALWELSWAVSDGLEVVLGIGYAWRAAGFLGIHFAWGMCRFVVR